MPVNAKELLTAGNIAKELGVAPGAVKKAIVTLKIAPTAKKGACSYYGPDAVQKIKKTL